MSDSILTPGYTDAIIKLVAAGIRVEHTISTSADGSGYTSWSFMPEDDDGGEDDDGDPVDDDLAFLQARKRLSE